MPPIDSASAIDAIASKAMGVPSAMPGVPPAQDPANIPRSGNPAPKAKPVAKETAEDAANEQAAPRTEDDKMSENPVLYEVAFGENDKRKLTPEQIAATFQRYSSLNHQNAQMKPVNDVIQAMMKANPGATPGQVAEGLIAMARSSKGVPNTFGAKEDAASPNKESSGPKTNEQVEAELSKWEQDNAASLPPGYKDFMLAQTTGAQSSQQMASEMAQMRQVMAAVLQRSQGVADAAKDQATAGKDGRVQQMKQAISTNLDRSQLALQLPDDKAEDFMVFAAERGFTLEDFIDPRLTHQVMQDFSNQMNSPEMERLRAISKRRQAYTGSIGSSPGAGAAAGGNAGGGTFDGLVDGAMSKLNPG